MYQNMFAIRLQQPFFPNTLHFCNQQLKYGCGMTKMVSIFIERIPYRLSSFNNIPYNLAISLLYYLFSTYDLLYKSHGLFHVADTMICFDRDFKVKAWHNSDISCIGPELPYCQTVVEMINSIVNCV
jgi:hypothetical protein